MRHLATLCTVLLLAVTLCTAGTVSLTWTPVTHDQDGDPLPVGYVDGYVVAWGEAPGEYTQEQTTPENVITVTIPDCTTFYFAVKAYHLQDDGGQLRSPAWSPELSGWGRPEITNVSTASLKRGIPRVMTVTGANFQEGATVEAGSEAIVQSVTVGNCTQLVTTILAESDHPLQSVPLSVVNPDRTYGEMPDALVVVDPEPGDVEDLGRQFMFVVGSVMHLEDLPTPNGEERARLARLYERVGEMLMAEGGPP